MDAELARIASRVVWWKTPGEVLAREDDFLCRVMAVGAWSDVNYVEGRFGAARLLQALEHAAAGVFDPRSWHYWHHRLGRWTVGPLPSRTFLVDFGSSTNVSFFSGLAPGRVEEPDLSTDTNVLIASLLDLAAQEVRVVQVRAERKDYLDLATLLERGITLSGALGAASALYPAFAPLPTLKALSYFEDGDLPDLPESTRARLAAAAAAVRDV